MQCQQICGQNSNSTSQIDSQSFRRQILQSLVATQRATIIFATSASKNLSESLSPPKQNDESAEIRKQHSTIVYFIFCILIFQVLHRYLRNFCGLNDCFALIILHP